MTSTTRGTKKTSVTVSSDTGLLPSMRAAVDAPLPADEQALDLRDRLPRPFPFVVTRSGVYTRLRVVAGSRFLPKPLTGLPGSMSDASAMGDLTPNPDGPLPGPLPFPNPLPTPQIPVPTQHIPIPIPLPIPFPTNPKIRYGTEELRVDVDGRAPTMTVSGVIPGGRFGRKLTWIARVSRTAGGTYAGPISYRDGPITLLPQTQVEVALHPALPIGALSAVATFTGGPTADVTYEYAFDRSDFREVNFEFDRVSDASEVTSYDTASHPNRPAGLAAEVLTIESGYGHMGIKVTRSGDSVINLAGAGANGLWSDIEMHDAMQVNWSRWADLPQWALWVMFARQHETGPNLGGIMFDSIGAAQRQGTAIFSESFVATAPAGDPAPAAWVQRMLFWTAMHEIGHSFNLAHSWQKSLGTGWVPLANDVEARSYMNYPYRVAAAPGRTAEQTFFANFNFRFSDDELLFMRHAPERMVEQGNAAWFDHHAFEQTRAETSTPLELVARVHRTSRFEFLEPVTIELKLKNITDSPIVVDAKLLESDEMVLMVARRGGEPRTIRPYARRCYVPESRVLMPGESLYASTYLSSDVYGSAIDQPGEYQIYAILDLDEVEILAAPLAIAVMPPASRDAERIAPDVLSDAVGRTLAFGGTRVMTQANDILAEAADRLPGSRIARHAEAALGQVAARAGKIVEEDRRGDKKVRVQQADVGTALEQLGSAYADIDAAADTFGHIEVTQRVIDYAETVKKSGDAAAAGAIAGNLADTLAARGVKQSVVDATREKAAELRR